MSNPLQLTPDLSFQRIIHNKEKFLARFNSLNTLEFFNQPLKSGHYSGNEAAALFEIENHYRSACVLFSLGFFENALDNCRKIIELLVRYQQDITPQARVENVVARIKYEVDWAEDVKNQAIEIYSIGNYAIHANRTKLLDHASEHTPSNDSRVSKSMANITINISDIDGNIIKKRLRGIYGMEKFALIELNKTAALVEKIISSK